MKYYIIITCSYYFAILLPFLKQNLFHLVAHVIIDGLSCLFHVTWFLCYFFQFSEPCSVFSAQVKFYLQACENFNTWTPAFRPQLANGNSFEHIIQLVQVQASLNVLQLNHFFDIQGLRTSTRLPMFMFVQVSWAASSKILFHRRTFYFSWSLWSTSIAVFISSNARVLPFFF